MSLVIDTCAYIAFINNRSDVVAAMRAAETIFLPAIVYGELVFGYHKGNRLAENRERLDRFVSQARVQTIAVNQAVADQYGRMRALQEAVGKVIGPNDLWIAAVCLHLQLPLLTTDDGFENISQLQFVLPPQR